MAQHNSTHSSHHENENHEEEDEDDSVNISRVKNKLWLLRIPEFLFEQWNLAEAPEGKNLGKLRFYNPT